MQKKMTKKILHITPHLGGGVGRVLLGYLSRVKENSSFMHQVTCLDYANKNASSALKNMKLGLSDKMTDKKEELLKMIVGADIILIHWWNHPLLYDFLVRTPLPPCRLVMWSHTSGLHPPAVFTEKILNYPDKFAFTTPVSLETKEVQGLSNKQKRNLRVVWSTGDLNHIKSIKPKKHRGFNVGYIGTVDYAKIHPNFLNICDKIKIPGVKFIVCGGPNEKEIRKEVKKLGLDKKFRFTGLISDVTKYLSIFDVFGYPLTPHHYGTCDQVLQESMAAGVVPVVLKNQMEKHMIKNRITGIVAKNEADYIRAIETLYKNKSLRDLLSQNAREYAVKTFSINKMVKDWEKIFEEVLVNPKAQKRWSITGKIDNISAADIFLESLGDHGKNFVFHRNARKTNEKRVATQKIKKMTKSVNWQSETKSTVHHYNHFFPDDNYLSEWSQLMKKAI